MKSILTPLLLCIALVTLSLKSDTVRSEYDIAQIYKGVDLPRGAKVLTDDEITDAEQLLTPLKLETGKYVLNVSKKGSNVYKVDGKDIYIVTKYCYEYATSEEVVLKVESSYGYTLGKLIF